MMRLFNGEHCLLRKSSSDITLGRINRIKTGLQQQFEHLPAA
jgi:hypothetical protein